MANIADTTLKLVFDEPGAAREMNEVLQQLDEKGWNIRLCDLAERYGIDYEKEHISVRGSVNYFELDDECSVMTIDTESAWTAPVELFDAIAEKIGEGVTVNYRCIELGCEIVQVRDSCGFFPEECLVSYSGEPFGDGAEEPFDSVYDALNNWCIKMGVEWNGRSEQEMREFIEDYDYGDDDVYYNIYDFEFE